MKKLVLSSLVLSLSVFSVSCAKKQRIATGEAIQKNVTSDENVTATVVWVRNRKSKIETMLLLENNYKHNVSFVPSAVRMTFNGQRGIYAKSAFQGQIPPGGIVRGKVRHEFYPKIPKDGKLVVSFPKMKLVNDEGDVVKKSVPGVKIPVTLAR